jgi:hypothetical protein
LTDAVEKGKNGLIEFFTCAPVESVISKFNASQRAYEGCWSKIGLIMCPPTPFSDHRTSASEKIRSAPQKDYSTASVKTRLRGLSERLLLIPQLQTYRWVAPSDAMGHEETS